MSQLGPRGGRKMVEKAEGLSVAQQFQQNAVSTTDEKEKTGFACFRNEQVESLEDKLTLCRQALEEVDFKLRREELTSARRESLEKEKNMLETKAEIYGDLLLEDVKKQHIPFPWMDERTIYITKFHPGS
ncbi:coiled-coil domain-containing protein 167 isoform X3 [Ahaetulla prasina]|uniref:coiled-coil domain-containing protein 167 isoform X3 n=1 Tax=Ahaetulla prasina TaxID=499056 RepID=UPI00264994B0|nr:coiled-coil domain-containing protein 167 isoform X3 [Ahaetulla prasina]